MPWGLSSPGTAQPDVACGTGKVISIRGLRNLPPIPCVPMPEHNFIGTKPAARHFLPNSQPFHHWKMRHAICPYGFIHPARRNGEFDWGVVTLACLAQEPQPPAAPATAKTRRGASPSCSNYVKPASHFPNPVGPDIPKHAADPNLANTARIDQLMHDGKLYLSLRMMPLPSHWRRLTSPLRVNTLYCRHRRAAGQSRRSDSGCKSRGRAEYSGWLGAGGIGTQVGTGTGGTTPAGGAGAGAGGIVESASGEDLAPQSPASISIVMRCKVITSGSSAQAALCELSAHVSAISAYQQGFHWGTNLNVGFNNSRITGTGIPFDAESWC